ncbi:MAG: peptidoglycan bridge formation protein FemAB [Patescibacteria group bacterium]|nr:MAG: peptidoglycan bridge formation protein FemAB [Patescibacteria group bacterium]
MPEIKVLEKNFDIKEYEKYSRHPMQSYYWGQARSETGVEVYRFGKFVNNKLTAVFQMTVHKLPYLNWKLGYLARTNEVNEDLLRFLNQFSKDNNIFLIKIEPYIFVTDNYKLPKLKNFVKSTTPLFPEWTQILDLSPSESELLSKMKPKTRYNIRLAQKKGVIVKEISNDYGFKIFSDLYFQTCKRQNYKGHNEFYHKVIWRNLKNKIAHILIAFYKNKPLAAYEIFLYKNRLYYPYGGSSTKYRNLMASNLLMWETIRFGKRNQAEFFDMWGSLPPNYNPNDPWAGFTKFKQGYGTKFEQTVGSWDLVINNLKYQIFKQLWKLRKTF